MENILMNCRECYLFGIDSDETSVCYLGYHTEYTQLPDGEWYQFSDNCELVEIKTRSETLYPKPLKTHQITESPTE